ncbi:probable serine/threonine-protein kinase DDB_G0282963 isoform X2 [Condylostylus longicornis]|uniref:probable serine/threonine-protein kinase DDB_G0282963 isoform X2 n=1 Tax=Condylostylus longicornis TaxID=2530218 RepID=UPI00244E2BD8|nr:probable serine/threonine-protein kinase DDB_G0282963 isoform X2 [Condylostylus longicornis]
MFNKIFRRGKTTKDDVPPLPSYKNSLKSTPDYEYGSKNYNLNNRPSYSTQSNTSLPNKYTPINDVPPPWSNYDTTKYDSTPINRTQNVYTAPPQRNLPYNQPPNNNNNIPAGREHDKPFQQFSVGSPNQTQYIPPPYKTNNLTYSNRNDKPDSRYDTTSGDRSPYITLGSTYSQGRPPPYEPFKRDGSTSRAPNSQPGTPTAGRRELYDAYRSTPSRTFESPQRDPIGNRSAFPPSNSNRFGARVYESPAREHTINKNSIGPYSYNAPSYASDMPHRNVTSPYNEYSNPHNQESSRLKNNRNAFGPNYNNSVTTNYNDNNTPTYKPTFNANNISNPSQAPPSPEPGKYVPYAVRKALKEQQQQLKEQQAKEDSKVGYYNSNSNNSSNPVKSKSPTSKYTFNPYKTSYESSDPSNKINSPYSSSEKPPYNEQIGPKIVPRNFETPGSRLVSPPTPNYGNRFFEQKSYNEPPELPPKNIILKNKTTDFNRNLPLNTQTSQIYPTSPNYGYYNADQNENKSPYINLTNQTPYSPSFQTPTPSQHEYINLSATPKPFSNSQQNSNVPIKNSNYEFNNNINSNADRFNNKQLNSPTQNINTTNLFNTINNTAPDAYSNTTSPHYNDTFTNYKTTFTPLSNENKHADNTISNRNVYEPQKNLYDTHKSYVQMPQYNYGSGEHATTTIPTNTNAFDDWLPKNASNSNENSSHSSTRNESELWKRREKDNAGADEFSSTAFGTVPSNLNANDYFNDKKNLEHRGLNNDLSLKADSNFDRYSTPKQSQTQEQQEKPIFNYKLKQQIPSSQQISSTPYSIASPLLDAATISVATVKSPVQPVNDKGDDESENEHVSSSEKINEATSEDRSSKSPKKSVRFFNNPIDKSRDFISDIMAKGRNRGHHNKHRNNNNNNNNKKSKDTKSDVTKSPLIVSSNATTDLQDLESLNSKNESEILNNLKNISDLSGNKNVKNENSVESNTNNNTEDDKIGYQITKSKNSRDIVQKLQNSRAKLASPEDDESDNIFGKNERNSADNHKNKCDDTDNTDTETLDEAFEDDDDTIKISNIAKKIESTESLQNKTSQNDIKNSKSACENNINNTESSSEKKISSQNIQQQPLQTNPERNSNLSSVNENNSNYTNRSSARVGNSQPSVSTTRNTSKTDSYENLKKNSNKNNNKKNKNDEQIEKIEKLSELAECDRDNFIKTQTTSMGQTQAKASTSTAKPESPRLGRSRSSSPPNRTSNKPIQLNSSDYAEIYKCSSQREREPVIEEPLSPTTPLSPTESCDQFYDLTNDTSNITNPTTPLPKVTVADYSEESHNSNIEPDVFYDFETINTNYNGDKNLSKSPPKYPPPPLSPSAQFKSRSTSPIDIVTLEDIEEEEDEDDWHFVSDNKNDSNNNENTSSNDKSIDSKQQQNQQQQNSTSPKTQNNYLNSPTFGRKMDTLTISAQQKPPSPILSRKSPLRHKSPFDYDDHTDGLNTPDSGIGGATTPISVTITANSSINSSNKVLVINSCDLVNDTDDIELLQSHQKQSTSSSNYFNIHNEINSNNIHNNGNIINFCETNNYIEHNTTSIVIDSISLPDVVIESKPKETDTQNQLTVNNNNQNGDYILNVSKSKSEGNVHFIPIHVEGREKPKIEIVEETTEFSSSIDNNNNNINNINDSNNIINNGFIEDISNQNNSINNSDNFNNNNNVDIISDINVIKAEETASEIEEETNENLNGIGKSIHSKDNEEDYKKLEKDLQRQLKKVNEEKQKKEEELKRELVSQEARFNAQLQEAQKNASSAQERAHELQMKIDQLEQDISLKSWHIERLNGEIQAIQQEHSSVRKRLQTIEDEKERLRQKHLDEEDEFNIKYENLEDKYKELEEKYNKLRQLASTLQTQLATAKGEVDDLRTEKDQLCEEKDAQLKNLQELLDKAIEERKELEIKWQKEFELLRNHNQEHEEQLLTDCEYQLRSMQKKCKEKIEAAEKAKQEALERNAELEEKVAEGEGYNERLKNLQAEVRQLRGLTNEQRESITYMHAQIEELKNDLEAANIDLESKIEEVRKIKLFCDNTLLFKDREMIQKIDEATREVATIWEDKLLTEMTRLTNELEAVHSEERLSDMNKLQAEHIEELKVLTNRYTSNEEELRKQLEEVSEKLQEKTEKYLELRDKTDEEILKTRIHLDKADREYQQAMNRELDKKLELEENLRKEFEEEKAEMEADFQRRINEIKQNFKKEMANQTQEIAERHRLQLEQQWDQLAAEKEDALQTLEKRHKIKLEDQENRLRNLETQHRRDLKDLKEAYDLDRSALQNRDIHNSQEIEQLHRKCRCLTNLFEEMRLRYERREPRPEDLREIDELRARCDSQERDLCELTERLREMQMQMEEMQAINDEQQHRHSSGNRKKQPIRKPPPKQIPISCDVIYEEENEETESLGDENKNGEYNNDTLKIINKENKNDNIEEEEEEDDEDEEEED